MPLKGVKIALTTAALLATLYSANAQEQPKIDHQRLNEMVRSGDIIAHTSKSNQSKLIKGMTGSDYTHIGLIEKTPSQTYVIEAVQPVKRTPLETWIDRGLQDRYTVKRVSDKYTINAAKTIAEAKKHLGKPYDSQFMPSDKKMYCSELVYKAFQRGSDLAIGKWENFQDIVGWKQYWPKFYRAIQSRWGKSPEMKVITPEAIMESPKLKTVYTTME